MNAFSAANFNPKALRDYWFKLLYIYSNCGLNLLLHHGIWQAQNLTKNTEHYLFALKTYEQVAHLLQVKLIRLYCKWWNRFETCTFDKPYIYNKVHLNQHISGYVFPVSRCSTLNFPKFLIMGDNGMREIVIVSNFFICTQQFFQWYAGNKAS